MPVRLIVKWSTSCSVLFHFFPLCIAASVKSTTDQGPMSVHSQAHTPMQQAHTPGMARTPGGAPLTPGNARTPGGPLTPGSSSQGMAMTPGTHAPHTPGGMAHTPGTSYTPGSVPPPPNPPTPKGPSKHLVYVTHFPIPQDEFSTHECNQRMVTLYGVGKLREEARHQIKKVSREIMKLFGRKNSLDITSGDVGKQKKKKDAKDSDLSVNYEAMFTRFQKLSYHDQHAVTSACANTVVEVVSGFAASNSSYLPLIDNISYLFDLMEYCYNVSGLMDFMIQVSVERIEMIHFQTWTKF